MSLNISINYYTLIVFPHLNIYIPTSSSDKWYTSTQLSYHYTSLVPTISPLRRYSIFSYPILYIHHHLAVTGYIYIYIYTRICHWYNHKYHIIFILPPSTYAFLSNVFVVILPYKEGYIFNGNKADVKLHFSCINSTSLVVRPLLHTSSL